MSLRTHIQIRETTFADVLFVVLILFILVGLLLYPIHAVISDFWYHLATARAALTQKMIPLHDWWDFQPIGRPHFYPPLIHLILALIAQAPEKLITVGYYLGTMLYASCITSAWYFYRTFWGPNVALVATALVTTNLIFTLAATSLMPAALISLILPLYIVALLKKKKWPAIFLLTASFYAHLSMPWFMFLGTAALMKTKNQANRRLLRSILGWSIFFASPWLVHVLFSILSLNLSNVIGSHNPLAGIGPFAFLSHYDLNIFFALLVLFGMWKLRKVSTQALRLLRIFCISFLPMLLFYGGRYWWHLIPLFAVFAVVPFQKTIDRFFASVSLQKLFVIIAFSSFLVIPTFELSYNSKVANTLSIDPEWTALDMILIPTQNLSDTQDFKRMTAFIEEHTKKEDLLSVDTPVVAEMLFTATSRRTNNGQFWESSGTIPGIQNQSGRYGAYVFGANSTAKPGNLDIVQNFGEYSVGIPKI